MENRSFLRALFENYYETDDDTEEVHFISRKEVKMIGFDKIKSELRDLERLRIVILNSRDIDRSYDESDGEYLKKTYREIFDFQLKSLEELDISSNKIRSWKTVSDILKFSPKIKELILTDNPIEASIDDTDNYCEMLKNLNHLILGKMNYSWDDIDGILKIFTNLSKLNLFQNNIRQINLMNTDCLKNLVSLNLCNNPILSWDEILKFGNLQRLEYLDVSKCDLNLIDFHCYSQEKTQLFPVLKHINLRTNQIKDWFSIAQLNTLKSLKSLMLKNNGIYELNKYYVIFNSIVSIIESLATLDGEPITQEMRNDCEKYYFRNAFQVYYSSYKDDETKLKNDFYEKNPTFQKLLQKFGEPAIGKKLTKEEQINEKFIKLNVQYLGKKIVKQVPKTMSVMNLKLILRRLFKIDRELEFDLEIIGNDNCTEDIMDDRHEVGRYRIDEDHTLSVITFS